MPPHVPRNLGSNRLRLWRSAQTSRRTHRRSGAVLATVAVALPVMIGVVGLVIDTSILLATHRNLQSVADSAATSAAMAIYQGGNAASATSAATVAVQSDNALANATITVNAPPTSGQYAGVAGYVEVTVTQQASTYFVQILGASSLQTVSATSVSGAQPATAGAAVVLLDPNPPGITVNLAPVPVSLTLPPVLGGLQVLGLGPLIVNGAILDNNQNGGVDQNGNPAGNGPAPPYAASCTPLVSLTDVQASNIRVVGGVDNANNFKSLSGGGPSPLKCNMLPVPDPFSSLPAPSTAVDPNNVSATNYGGMQIVALPLLGTTTLNPGVYDWIEVVSGTVIFKPGVYIIRNVNPLTQIALSVLAGQVKANGVMFYITNSTNYSATSGSPDSGNSSASPGGASLGTLLPSVVIASLLGSSYSGLNDPTSPFNGLLIYQNRTDRRPIVLADETLILGGSLSGTVYAKYGQLIFAANGTYNLQLVAGSMLFLNVLECNIQPSTLMAPAQDVYLVQ